MNGSIRSFAVDCYNWALLTFGTKMTQNAEERSLRFLEESLELVQSLGLPKERATEIIEYVYSRPAGEPHQEVGGVMVTLAVLCGTNSLDLSKAAANEIARCYANKDKIRTKAYSKGHVLAKDLQGTTFSSNEAELRRFGKK